MSRFRIFRKRLYYAIRDDSESFIMTELSQYIATEDDIDLIMETR